MSMKPHKGQRGEEQAKVTCDDCGSVEIVKACHGSSSGGQRYNAGVLRNEGQVIRKMESAGWANVKNKLRCPTCEAERREQNNSDTTTQKEEQPMKHQPIVALQTVKDELRKPTPKQKREIIGLLEDVYDDVLLRYRGKETDKAVAETIGDVMPGWVAEIRDDMFGPDGSNDEMEALMSEMRVWRDALKTETDTANKRLAAAESAIRAMNAAIAKVAEFEKRQAAIIKAVGPKAHIKG